MSDYTDGPCFEVRFLHIQGLFLLLLVPQESQMIKRFKNCMLDTFAFILLFFFNLTLTKDL